MPTDDCNKKEIHRIPIQKPTASGHGGDCHVVCQQDRVTVVFAVDFDDEADRALARLYLQQFAKAKGKGNGAPLCGFRRGGDPPREVASVYDDSGEATGDIAGFLSFTFLGTHINSVEKRERAVGMMVTFLTYLDYHIKASKTNVHTRMRNKRNDLLGMLLPS